MGVGGVGRAAVWSMSTPAEVCVFQVKPCAPGTGALRTLPRTRRMFAAFAGQSDWPLRVMVTTWPEAEAVMLPPFVQMWPPEPVATPDTMPETSTVSGNVMASLPLPGHGELMPKMNV